MRLLRSNAGTIATHVSGAAVRPEKGLDPNVLVDFVCDLYAFSVRPNVPPTHPCADEFPLVFLGGRFGKGFEQFASLQLAMFPEQHTIAAKTTDVAETVLYDLIDNLNQLLDYRFDLAKQRLSYASSVVVAFDRLDPARSIPKIPDLLNSKFPQLSSPFRSTKLSLCGSHSADGRGDGAACQNVFCSSAPMTTSAHVQLLEQIENSLAR